MGVVSANQQTSFSNPQNGQAPDADVVRNNDNALVAKHNAHDADATLHVQTGLLSARPAAATPYAMYLDENKRLYVDNGAVWAEVPYARLDAAGTNAFANNVTIGGTLGVTGLLTGGNVDVLDVDAADIIADSYTGGPIAATGNSSIAGTLTGLTGITSTGTVALSAGNLTLTTGQGITAQHDAGNSGTALTINFNNGNAQKCVLTGNCVLTFSNPVAGASYVLLATQDGVGGRSLTFPSTVRWEGGTPSLVTTVNRASVFAFYYTGTRYIGSVIGTGVDVS